MIINDLGYESTIASRRFLQTTLNTKAFTYVFKIKGKNQSRRYTDIKIFKNSIRRHLLDSGMEIECTHHYLREEHHVERATQEDSCADGCPTVEAFLSSYNNTITDLKDKGVLVNVVATTGAVAELVTVDCSADVSELSTVIDVTFEGDPDNEPSDAELEILAASFVESYNSVNALNGATCDPLFRVAVEAKIELVRADESSGRKLQNGNYNAKLNQKYKCRACKGNDRIYSQGTSRHHQVLSSRTGTWTKRGMFNEQFHPRAARF